MNPADSVKRAALNAAIDYLLADPEKNMPKAMEAVNKYDPAGIFPAQRQAFANAIGNETNWYQLLLKVAHLNPEMIGGLLKTFVVDANFLAWGKQERMRTKYGCNIPWAILLDPTSACNLHCLGCWAADYGHKLNLTFEDIDSIVCQGKELGVHVYIHTGGEPLVRKDDVIALCRKHPDCALLCFTNATLIDEKFCQDMIEVKNFIPAISAEGFEETTDARRGEGTDKRIRHGMDLLRSYALPFGVFTCYTSQNASAVCTEEYFDWMSNREPEQPCARQPCRTWLSTTAGNTSSKRSLLPNPREHNAGPGANQKTATPHEHANSGASPSLRHVYLPTLGRGQGTGRKRGHTHPAACMQLRYPIASCYSLTAPATAGVSDCAWARLSRMAFQMRSTA